MADKILIVDDEVIIRDYIAEFCKAMGFEVISAGNGQEALNLLKREHPALIITDVMMPVINGLELIKEVKQLPSFEQTPIIVISAVEDIDNIVKCIELGAVDYIAKPFERKILAARIKSTLELSKLRKMVEEAKIIDAGDKLVTEMAATFSHHVNQPLTVALTDLALYEKLIKIFGDFTTDFEVKSKSCKNNCMHQVLGDSLGKIGCNSVSEFVNELNLCVDGLKSSLKDVKDLVIKFKDIVRPHKMAYAGGSNIIDIEESQKKTVLLGTVDFKHNIFDNTDIIDKIGAENIVVNSSEDFEKKLAYSRPHIAILLTDSLNHEIVDRIASKKMNKEVDVPVAILTMSGEIKDTSNLIYFDHIVYEADVGLFWQKFEAIYCEMLNKESSVPV